jgi:hypothetical protein
MKEMDQEIRPVFEHLAGKVDQHISSFKSRRDFNRKWTLWFSIIASSISATTTVTIGAKEIYSVKLLALIALALSSFSTVIYAISVFYNFKSRWIQTNETLMNLYELKSDITYKSLTCQLNTTDLDKFYIKLQDILKSANTEWRHQRLEQAKSKSS